MNIYGLLGKDIGYSFSRNYFSDKFKKENLDYQYQNFDLKKIEELTDVIKNPNIKGMNVTIPYKEEVIAYLDNLDPIAKEIGAVNVVKFERNGNLKGYNSDHYGFSESLKPLLNENTKKALILGTGGASKAIAYSLKKLHIDYSFVSRNPDFQELSYLDLDEDIIRDFKLIINCTPLGTHPNTDRHPDIPYEYLGENHVLYDLIYNPEETTFMKKGKKKGATTSNGLNMLIQQAEKSWEIWNS
ncbi:shikimate dehydrogenase family protein [Aquimarina sp. 2201CG14-23]|uniref:shikimate dehydrogenase family protein n=1 Tax=Aquimarina mycalae TaxID=3040073 RepID=UPI002477EEC4|nr:shikimate dehydrogenase [Aquimarina sp. 2201CG14-23]MDH7447029.1 shikimate dehydrogenase [Aquimarina sp. 2201CG14-23]